MDLREVLELFNPDYSRLDRYTIDKIMDLLSDIHTMIEDEDIPMLLHDADVYIDPMYYIGEVSDCYYEYLIDALARWKGKAGHGQVYKNDNRSQESRR